MSYHFQAQAYIAVFNVSLNIALETQAIIFIANELCYFINTKMTY